MAKEKKPSVASLKLELMHAMDAAKIKEQEYLEKERHWRSEVSRLENGRIEKERKIYRLELVVVEQAAIINSMAEDLRRPLGHANVATNEANR